MKYKSPAANIGEANEIRVELLITDAKVALSLLDQASTTKIAEDRSRRLGEAHHAYQTILTFLPRLRPTEEQRSVLTPLMSTLGTRLRAAGVAIK